ncbi:S9 family peptidase [Acidicapsa dinghuensis]|uniref:S9 family peptidase n=1 Tax=Acidicapsa dinghuensis TaxID=2218256 RepID=A0ABW1EIC8_9BACT|nr:S9 family peptidase [Acidicapsa dinghuensis]
MLNTVLSSRKRIAFCALISFSFCAFDSVASAQGTLSRSRVEQVLQGLGRAHGLGSVAISPDGTKIAFVRQAEHNWQVMVAPFGDLAKAARVTAAKRDETGCNESSVAWGPDSRHLAFLGNCPLGESQENVYLATFENGTKYSVERLTDAHGEVGYPNFSPDGSKIAFLYVEGATRAAGALAAMKPWAGVIGEDGVEVQRVAMVSATAHNAKPEFVTPGNLHAYEFDWSPDSKALAYVAAEPPGENNWWVAKLYTQQLGGGPKAILAPAEIAGPLHGLQIAVPRWSPDGKQIAFIGGLMSDQGSTGGDVWVISSEGGEPRDVTPDTKTSPAWMVWKGDDELFVSELAGGNSQLVDMKLGGDAPRVVYSVPGTVGDGRMELSLSTTQDRSVFVFHAVSFEHPVEIYAAQASGSANDLSGLKQLTHVNDGITPIWGKSESVNWKDEGFDVQGWLLFPAHYDPAKKYGLIVLVHGGPAGAAQSSWGGRGSLSAPAFSAMDYFVLEPNPRGSFGQGEAFTQANRKDFGYGDLRDILAGVDTVVAKYPIDKDRVGLTGWSYGGFMTMFAVTQTHRFKAAVAGAGISDWESYYGENSIDQWMIPYFGASVYDDPKVYAKSSAIDFIHNVKTPTLAVVGDRDGECPAPQSFEFWHALRDEHVPTQLVVYPNEGHGFVNPEHRTDVLVRALEWFAKYMPAE